MTTLLGIDVGATRVKAVAIDESGPLLASATADLPTLIPRPGWSEQDPSDWWRASREVLGRVGRAVGGDVAAVGLSGQMHGAVFLDERGDVVRPALLGSDQRTSSQCEEIAERIGWERLIDITGNPALPSFQAPKILWLRDVEPVQYRHVRHVLPPKDYIRFRLTGELATDVSDASATLLYDLRRRDWSRQILAALEIPLEWLPAVSESGEVSGRLSPSVAEEFGLPPGIPIAAGCGDRIATTIAAGIVQSGLISSSIGSSGVLFASTERPLVDPSGRLRAACHAIPQHYGLMALTLFAGESLRWWRDILGGSLSYEQLATLGSSAPAGAESLFFIPGPRGAFAGLRTHHSKAHLTRAVMEGVVFSLRQGLDAMRDLGLAPQRVRASGAAASSPLWRQLQANIFNLPVERPVIADAAYGAALLAGVAAGSFDSVPSATQRVRVRAGATEPDDKQVKRYDSAFSTFRNLYPALQEPGRSGRSASRASPQP